MSDKAKSSRTRLSLERQRELADLAESVIEAHCPGKIEPDKIIDAKGIALFYDHYENAFDGMIECEGSRFFIHCNLDRDNLPGTPRARFTLAHELGHYFIDEHRNNLLSGAAKPHPSLAEQAGEDLLVEREADFFASRLLLPESRFRAASKKIRAGATGISELAQKFDVSLSCAAIRVVAAEIFPAVVVKWSSDKVGWKWSSRTFWDHGFRSLSATRGTLPRDSATAKALAHAGPGAFAAENATTAAFWFKVADKHARNIVLKEEAISLGKFGALTILTLIDGKFPREILTLRNHELGFEKE